MESIDTRYYRDQDGWNGKTTVAFQGNQVLVFSTYRAREGLRTRVSCHTRQGTSLVHAMGLGTGLGDFSETVAFSKPARVTERLVTEQHEAALGQLDRIRVQVELFYKRQAETKAAKQASTAG